MSEKRTIITNFVWRLLERSGAEGVSLIVSLILARLLDPGVYGEISIVLVIISILQVFVDAGLANALIQKKDADDLDFSSVLIFNVLLCVVVYFLLYLLAPFIARFYSLPRLTKIIRVLGVIIIISSLKNVQQAYVSRNLLFKKFFISTTIGTVCSAFIGVWMAYKGFGVWALVAQNVLNQTIDTICLWIIVEWYPRLIFSFERLKSLLTYSWKLLAASLLNEAYRNLRKLIIGKIYSSESLAYYNRGEQFPQLLQSNISASLDSVMFPVIAKEQSDVNAVRAITKSTIVISTYCLMPMMAGLAACSDTIVRLILTDKWSGCIPFLRIFCFIYAFYPIHTSNLNAIKGIGRSDLFLKLEVEKKVADIVILLLSLRYGAMGIARGLLLSSIISLVINSRPNRELINYSFFEQIKDILPQIILSFLLFFGVSLLGRININKLVLLFLQIISGAAFYLLCSALLKLDTFYNIVSTAKNLLNTKSVKE